MHPISMVRDDDFEDITYVHRKKRFQSKYHRGFDRRDRWSHIVQLLLSVNEKVLCLLGSHESVASCCAPFFQSGKHAVPMSHWDVTSDYPDQVRDSPVWITIGDLLHLTYWLRGQHGTTRSWMDPLQLYGSSSWRKVKVRKGNLSLFPNGPVHVVIFVKDSATMNQKNAHWTMTDSTKIIAKKSFQLAWQVNHTYIWFGHFMRNHDDSCLVVHRVHKSTTSLITSTVVMFSVLQLFLQLHFDCTPHASSSF